MDERPLPLGDVPESDVPPGWTASPLTDLVTIASGQVDPREAPYRWWPLIAPNHIESETGHLLGEIETAEEQGAISGKYEVRRGDVVYSKIRPYLRKAWFADREALCSADMYPLRVNGNVDARYLLAIVLSSDFSRYAERMSARTGIPKINRDGLSGYHLPLPPLPEQRKIAAILSSVDAAIAATRKVIEQTKQVKQGLLQTLITRGIGHTRFKKTEIGEIPKAWEVVPLGKLASIRRGASPRPIRDPKWFSEAGAGWVRISDVTESDRFLRRTEQYLSPAGIEKSVPVARGDVIMSICATIGIPVIVDMAACIHDGFVVFQDLDSRVNPEFLRFFIEWKTAWLESLGQHGTQKNLNTGIVKSVLMAVPDRAEQDQIVEVLLKAEDVRRREERTLDQYSTMKRGLMQDLLTGRVRVQPD